MRVEPAMLLIYKSVDRFPYLTEKLIDYIYQYVKLFDRARTDEFHLSVQRVLRDCEQK